MALLDPGFRTAWSNRELVLDDEFEHCIQKLGLTARLTVRSVNSVGEVFERVEGWRQAAQGSSGRKPFCQ